MIVGYSDYTAHTYCNVAAYRVSCYGQEHAFEGWVHFSIVHMTQTFVYFETPAHKAAIRLYITHLIECECSGRWCLGDAKSLSYEV